MVVPYRSLFRKLFRWGLKSATMRELVEPRQVRVRTYWDATQNKRTFLLRCTDRIPRRN